MAQAEVMPLANAAARSAGKKAERATARGLSLKAVL